MGNNTKGIQILMSITGIFLVKFIFGYTLVLGQNNTVDGVVTDATTGETLPGVNITLMGTSIGTSTNSQGEYSLNISSLDDTLRFSFIGYRTQQVPINGRQIIDAALEPQAVSGEELVVVGYGNQERENLIGSVSKISSENIQDLPVAGVDQAIAGQMPGVQVQHGSGTPGGGPSITVRGLGSVSAAQSPLFVVDGFPIGHNKPGLNNPLNFISPSDIESITVLKDAASTAIYGSRGNGGVVIITTKKGASGRPSISFNSYVGLQTIPSYEKPDVLNAYEFAQFQRQSIEDEIKVTENREPTQADIPEHLKDLSQYGEGTDWYDQITRNEPLQNYNLSVRGGSENVSYYVSAEHLNQQGVVRGTGFKRFSFRANIDATISDKLDFGLNVSPSYQNQNKAPTDPGANGFAPGGGIMRARWSSPAASVRNPDGKLALTTQSPFSIFADVNPVLALTSIEHTRNTQQVMLNTFLEYDILDELSFKTTFGINVRDIKDEYYKPTTIAPGWNLPPPSKAVGNLGNDKLVNYLNENTLNFATTIDEIHQINAVTGFTFQKERLESSFFSGTDFPNDDIHTLNAASTITGGSEVQEWTLLSYLARVNYIYNDKYFLTGAFRTDGSSRFGADNRWGSFPSVSLGWRVSEESFFSGLADVINNLKLKASYGITGNNGIGNFAALGAIGSDNYILGGNFANGRTVSSIPNPNLGWEETRQFDFGFEAGLLNNRISLIADFYYSTTENLLFSVPVAAISGFNNSLSNIGKVKNKGMEFTIRSENLVNSNASWSTDFNISFNRNEVLALGQEDKPILELDGGDGARMIITKVGEPIGMFYGLQYQGLYTQEEINDPNIAKYPNAYPGSARFMDANGNGAFEREPDHVIIGNPNPDFRFGMTNDFRYKNLDLRITMLGAYGQDILDASREVNHNLDGVFNVSSEVMNRYRPGNDPTEKTIPTTVGNTSPWRGPNSTWVKDGSYLSVRNVTLGYRFQNVPFLSAFSFQNARLYLSIQNALMFSKYDGNPEINRVLANPRVQNISYGSYPIPRTFTLGINLSF